MLSLTTDHLTAQTEWAIDALNYIKKYFNFDENDYFTGKKNVTIEVRIGKRAKDRNYFSSKRATIALEKERHPNTHNSLVLSPNLEQKDSHRLLVSLLHDVLHCIDNNTNGITGADFVVMADIAGIRPDYSDRTWDNLQVDTAIALDKIRDELGDYPPYITRQKAQYLTVKCNNPEGCEMRHRMSQKQVDLLTVYSCPVCRKEDALYVEGEQYTIAEMALLKALEE